MLRRRLVGPVLAVLVVSISLLVAAAPAGARWRIHNDVDVTQLKAPVGGTESQTCPGRLRGETGWATAEDPATYEPPPSAYTAASYNVWKAPAGFDDFSSAEQVFNDQGQVIGYNFPDANGDFTIAAPKVLSFRTAQRTAAEPPIPVEDIAGLYVWTTAPINVALPSGVDPGDLLALLPSGGFEPVTLTVIACPKFTVSGTTIRAVKGSTFTAKVATFTGVGGVANYTAFIRWGDGTRSAGVISATASGFVVKGTHRYSSRGSYSVVVRITQKSSGVTKLATSTANVRLPG